MQNLSTNNQTKDTYRELDLTHPADRQLFLVSVADIARTADELETVADSVGYEHCAVPDVPGQEIFKTGVEKYQELRDFVHGLSADSPVSDQQVDTIQGLYNDLVLLRDHVVSVYEPLQKRVLKRVVAAPPPAARPQPNAEPPRIEQQQAVTKAPEKYVQPDSAPAVVKTPKPIEDDLEAYRSMVRSELARLMKKNGVPKIKQRLDRTIGRASSKEEIDQRKESLLRGMNKRSDTTRPETVRKEVSPKPQTQHRPTSTPIETIRPHASISLLGLGLPPAGPAGLAASMALRERLVVARDQHPQLRDDSQKQIIVDKLIRMLQVVPHGGLSAETDLPKIVAYAQAINLPDAFHPLASIPNVVSAETVVIDQDGPDSSEARADEVRMRKDMQIETEEDEGVVPIVVAGQVNKIQTGETPGVVVDPEPVSGMESVQSAVVAAVEPQDPVNVVEQPLHNTVVHPRPELEADSLTIRYLQHKSYQEFITTQYSTPAAFERMLDTTITQIESQSTDALERWLGEAHASPFMFLKEIVVDDVIEMSHDPGVRKLLAENNIKYDAFLIWIDLLPEMLAAVKGDYTAMTFGELYARWMIEGIMEYAAEQEVVQ